MGYTYVHIYLGCYIYKYKNEVGCRDDTVPKTVDTRKHYEEECEHATIFRNPQKLRCRDWVAEDCCMLSLLLAVPSCIYSFWHGVIPTSHFIFNDFYTYFTNFLSRLRLDCSARRDAIRSMRATRITYTYAHAYCPRELNGSCDVYMQSTIKWRRSKRKSP